MGTTIPIMAATFGAVMIEKHFTLDKNQSGPDHKASLEPKEFKQMVNEIRNVEKALGDFKKEPTISESKIMKNVRKSIVANKNINKETILTRDMLSFKRPALGINPAEMDNILGKKLIKDIKVNKTIKELAKTEDFIYGPEDALMEAIDRYKILERFKGYERKVIEGHFEGRDKRELAKILKHSNYGKYGKASLPTLYRKVDEILIRYDEELKEGGYTDVSSEE